MPQVIATAPPWLLTRDAGQDLRTVLRSGGAAPSWDVLLPLYAELQIDLAGAADELLSAGAPDRRPAAVASAYPELIDRVATLGSIDVKRLRALAPRVESLTRALEGSLPPTVIHEEFHETNVFVLAGKPRLLDWAEAAVSHPFAGLVNTLRDITYRRRLKPGGREMLRLRSVYLEPWTRFAPLRELEALFDQGYVLGALCRALTWDRVLAAQSAAVRAEYGRNAAVWLDLIFREAVENEVKLGA
jgi:aminoglycoside phosphotransferase (APT) family kinase protein